MGSQKNFLSAEELRNSIFLKSYDIVLGPWFYYILLSPNPY